MSEYSVSLYKQRQLNIPRIPFTESKLGKDGIEGLFGEIVIYNVQAEALPVIISAKDGSAVMDLTSRTPFIRYGTGSKAVTLSPSGIQFGAKKPKPWTNEAVSRMIAAVTKNQEKSQGALLLRAVLLNSYPTALAIKKFSVDKKIGAIIADGAKGTGRNAMKCEQRTLTTTVTRKVTKVLEIIKTAYEQYIVCVDREVTKAPCKDAGPLAILCAGGICAAKEFLDMAVGFLTVVVEVAEEVTKVVLTCATPKVNFWPTPWANMSLAGVKPIATENKPEVKPKDIDDGIKFLKNFIGIFGPFGKCMLDGEWSLAQLDTELKLNGEVVIPYGISVCLDANCASQLAKTENQIQNLTTWAGVLGILAALSPEFAISATEFGIIPNALVAAAIVGISPVAIQAAAIIFALILWVFIYATAISAQLWFHEMFTDNFDDGKVCIEHPTFALALITLVTYGFVPGALVPPIVTG